MSVSPDIPAIQLDCVVLDLYVKQFLSRSCSNHGTACNSLTCYYVSFAHQTYTVWCIFKTCTGSTHCPDAVAWDVILLPKFKL